MSRVNVLHRTGRVELVILPRRPAVLRLARRIPDMQVVRWHLHLVDEQQRRNDGPAQIVGRRIAADAIRQPPVLKFKRLVARADEYVARGKAGIRAQDQRPRIHPLRKRIQQLAPLVVVRIHQRRDPDLFEVVQILHAPRLLLRLAQRRQQKASENRDDRDDHQQLNQRESRRRLFLLRTK